MEKTVVILAGGASSRMGRDKAKLPYGDKTLLEHIIESYSKYFSRVIISVDRLHRFNIPNVSQVVDEYKNSGPLAGIHAVFNQTDVEEFFLTAVDIPFGEPELALKIMELGQGYSSCVIKRDSSYYEPLFAMYNRKCFNEVIYCLQHKQYSIKNLYEKVSVKVLSENEIAAFANKPLEEMLVNANRLNEYFNVLSKTDWSNSVISEESISIKRAAELFLYYCKNNHNDVYVISTLNENLIFKEFKNFNVIVDAEEIVEILAAAVENQVQMLIAFDEKSEAINKTLNFLGAVKLFQDVNAKKYNIISGYNLGGIPVLMLEGSFEKMKEDLDVVVKPILKKIMEVRN